MSIKQEKQPSVFIGSSGESLDIAEHIQLGLDRSCECTIWTQDVFGVNESALESLESALSKFDFAFFVLAHDDVLYSRSTKRSIVRDNVIFEMGLFIGRLGRKRVFAIHPRGKKPDMPTDLSGINFLDYKEDREDGNLEAALTSSLVTAKKTIKKLGAVKEEEEKEREFYSKSGSTKNDNHSSAQKRRVAEVLERGSTFAIDSIVDGAIFIAESKYKYKEELRSLLSTRRKVPTKYLYHTEEGCRLWLEICSKPEYTYYSKSVKLISSVASEIVSLIERENSSSEVDFISLGNGDGEKDRILLKEICSNLKDDERLFYYPIDISDPMIVEGIRNAMGDRIIREKTNVKAIIGDITALNAFEPIYEERDNVNVFSILGNTLGNSSEKEIIEALNQSLFPGDMILIEVNTDQDTGAPSKSFLKSELNIEHDFVPLESIGVRLNKRHMRYKSSESESVVPGTKTNIALYKEATINGRSVRDINLSLIHHYDFSLFCNEMEKRLEIQIIGTFEEEGVGILLGKKLETEQQEAAPEDS